MDYDVLNKLMCPRCGFRLEPKLIISAGFKGLIHGVVGCSQHQYPVIDGVLFLLDNYVTNRAFNVLLRYKSFFRLQRGFPIYVLSTRRMFKVVEPLIMLYFLFPHVTISLSTFVRTLWVVGQVSTQWKEYILKRNANDGFYPGVICMSLINSSSSVFDAGCGCGHLLAALVCNHHEGPLFGIDADLLNIYIAKRYICPEASYVYYNLEQRLPLVSGSLDTIYVVDAFHYIRDQERLASQLIDAISAHGTLIISNLLVKSGVHVYKNTHPHSLREYAAMFACVATSMYSESFATVGLLKKISKQVKKNDLDFVTLVATKIFHPRDTISMRPDKIQTLLLNATQLGRSSLS